MTAFEATWQILGNQTMTGRVKNAASGLAANLSTALVTADQTARATPTALQSQGQKDLHDPARNPKIPIPLITGKVVGWRVMRCFPLLRH